MTNYVFELFCIFETGHGHEAFGGKRDGKGREVDRETGFWFASLHWERGKGERKTKNIGERNKCAKIERKRHLDVYLKKKLAV